VKKPADCKCGFPEVHSETPTGHSPACPYHRRWLAEHVPGRMPVAIETRPGTAATPKLAESPPPKPGYARWGDGPWHSLAPREAPEAEPPMGTVSDPDVVVCNCAARARDDRPSRVTGHFEDCPAHKVITSPIIPVQPVPEPSEDRGTLHLVWHGGGVASFEPFSSATGRVEVSVPIGWNLSPHPREGVVLRSVFGEQYGPGDVLAMAEARHGGFKIRKAERIGAAHLGV
jgi:hypothetical protein